MTEARGKRRFWPTLSQQEGNTTAALFDIGALLEGNPKIQELRAQLSALVETVQATHAMVADLYTHAGFSREAKP